LDPKETILDVLSALQVCFYRCNNVRGAEGKPPRLRFQKTKQGLNFSAFPKQIKVARLLAEENFRFNIAANHYSRTPLFQIRVSFILRCLKLKTFSLDMLPIYQSFTTAKLVNYSYAFRKRFTVILTYSEQLNGSGMSGKNREQKS